LKVYPYPSLSDIFYFAFYPFAIYHLIKNSLYFKRKFEKTTKIWLSILALASITIYAFISFQHNGEANFDFYYGLLAVAPASITTSLAVLGLLVFRNTVLGSVWGLLVAGILILVAADTWYYYLEIFGQYSGSHVVNSLYLLSNLLVTYALYAHRKVI
jgi:hypothetical protein